MSALRPKLRLLSSFAKNPAHLPCSRNCSNGSNSQAWRSPLRRKNLACSRIRTCWENPVSLKVKRQVLWLRVSEGKEVRVGSGSTWQSNHRYLYPPTFPGAVLETTPHISHHHFCHVYPQPGLSCVIQTLKGRDTGRQGCHSDWICLRILHWEPINYTLAIYGLFARMFFRISCGWKEWKEV